MALLAPGPTGAVRLGQAVDAQPDAVGRCARVVADHAATSETLSSQYSAAMACCGLALKLSVHIPAIRVSIATELTLITYPDGHPSILRRYSGIHGV